MIGQAAALAQTAAALKGARGKRRCLKPDMDGGGENEQPWTRREITEGPWAGWALWGSDPFELHAGPFYSRIGPDGRPMCAFLAEKKHMNGGGFMHGGCLMTFADYALFAIGGEALAGGGSVTASLTGEFLDSAREGELIEATGEVTRAGGSLVFIRGTVTTGCRPLLTFSGIVKKVRRRDGSGATAG
jgi:acyl-coenzyme A thioesterase PaaI-like protein